MGPPAWGPRPRVVPGQLSGLAGRTHGHRRRNPGRLRRRGVGSMCTPRRSAIPWLPLLGVTLVTTTPVVARCRCPEGDEEVPPSTVQGRGRCGLKHADIGALGPAAVAETQDRCGRKAEVSCDGTSTGRETSSPTGHERRLASRRTNRPSPLQQPSTGLGGPTVRNRAEPHAMHPTRHADALSACDEWV